MVWECFNREYFPRGPRPVSEDDHLPLLPQVYAALCLIKHRGYLPLLWIHILPVVVLPTNYDSQSVKSNSNKRRCIQNGISCLRKETNSFILKVPISQFSYVLKYILCSCRLQLHSYNLTWPLLRPITDGSALDRTHFFTVVQRCSPVAAPQWKDCATKGYFTG